MLRVALLAALVIAALAPATSHAYWELAPDGQPLITTSSEVPDDLELRVCPPGGGTCEPVEFVQRAGWPGWVHEPGETAVGTTFELVRVSTGAVERSPAWQGRVTSTAAPTILGLTSTTGNPAPVAGTWTGGWGNDISNPTLVACVTAQGAGCTFLPPAATCPAPCVATPTVQTVPSGSGAAALPVVLGGYHLFALDRRLPQDQRGWPLPLLALWSFSYRFPLSDITSQPLVAVSAPVPIGPTLVEPPPSGPPAVALRKRALRSKGQLSLGTISCFRSCKVSVKVSGGGKKARTTTFTVLGLHTIKTPVRRGKLTVRVHADGKLLVNGKVSAR